MEGLFKALTGLFLILAATGIKAAAPAPMDQAHFAPVGAMDKAHFARVRAKALPALSPALPLP
jgi:hypothetical protein